MNFRSLDFAASECDGPQALTRSHPVPSCIESCKPPALTPERQVEASGAQATLPLAPELLLNSQHSQKVLGIRWLLTKDRRC